MSTILLGVIDACAAHVDALPGGDLHATHDDQLEGELDDEVENELDASLAAFMADCDLRDACGGDDDLARDLASAVAGSLHVAFASVHTPEGSRNISDAVDTSPAHDDSLTPAQRRAITITPGSTGISQTGSIEL